ncbi:transposase domain-containing protein [Anopheles sinensis]|uniref:Transposase domain-containing protein n=1 Tax=Anopheles sinensis TaxID=74873 RepID=A0A084VIH0_ANOSI|nr:transposase domain-containing protein [Anopheles sinensis]
MTVRPLLTRCRWEETDLSSHVPHGSSPLTASCQWKRQSDPSLSTSRWVDTVRLLTETNANKRTDDAFRNQEYVLHQTGSTPLMDLENFDMIEDIIVGDRLHQIDIEVTKKLLTIWYFGVLRSTKRWNQGQRQIINQRLQRQTFPLEAPRKLRCLDDLPYWKGSECKAFLHYAAPVALRGVLTKEQYQHFMLYFCGVIFIKSPQKTLERRR